MSGREGEEVILHHDPEYEAVRDEPALKPSAKGLFLSTPVRIDAGEAATRWGNGKISLMKIVFTFSSLDSLTVSVFTVVLICHANSSRAMTLSTSVKSAKGLCGLNLTGSHN